jgi:hypothetical protein
MGRPRKNPREWTSEQAINKLFPKRVVKHFKKAATDAEKSPEKPISKGNSS